MTASPAGAVTLLTCGGWTPGPAGAGRRTSVTTGTIMCRNTWLEMRHRSRTAGRGVRKRGRSHRRTSGYEWQEPRRERPVASCPRPGWRRSRRWSLHRCRNLTGLSRSLASLKPCRRAFWSGGHVACHFRQMFPKLTKPERCPLPSGSQCGGWMPGSAAARTVLPFTENFDAAAFVIPFLLAIPEIREWCQKSSAGALRQSTRQPPLQQRRRSSQ